MKKFTKFLKDSSGATAVTFGLLLVPLMGMTGLAVDYSVASNERSKLQNAADAAALAGASIFTGPNSAAAEALARAYLKANLGEEAANAVTINFKAEKQQVTVTLGGQTNTTFMRVLNKDSLPIEVTSIALAPLKPSSATITIDKVTGYWFKRVSIVVKRNGQKFVVGTITYTAADHNGAGGLGSGVTNPPISVATKYDLGEYDKNSLYLQMDIKNDGCDVGYRNTSTTNKVVCKTSTKSADAAYNSTLRTNDPSTYNNLFVDGKRLTTTSGNPLDNLLDCDQKEHEHWWEDGGSPSNVVEPDFLYRVKSECKSVDGELVRLTH
ncbi:pilus assembly protein [Phyllobacterium sp. LjRoot231]|uniref:TadE/TadG family type IV pilus assembly protein n=1 Tax=Phyllobacterium sp. LjRoot231 TaxID=3342289 RepID=UPI003ED0374A